MAQRSIWLGLAAAIAVTSLQATAGILPKSAESPKAIDAPVEHKLPMRGIATDKANVGRVVSTAGSDSAKAVVQRIISAIGIPMTNFQVRASVDVDNAVATTDDDGQKRYILYNPSWMEDLSSSVSTDWARWVVLAHEVGHHVAFHMDPAFPNHEAELQADYFAGFILKKMGAPLSDVLLAIAMVSSDDATETHPGKLERVAQIKKGWEAAGEATRANFIPAAMPISRPNRSVAITSAPVEQRLALLIGNSDYENGVGRLKNPKNDVIAVGRQLRRLGFSTTIVYDASAEQISSAMKNFKEEAADADWAVFYYSGQGVEIDGVNYMIPVDADAKSFGERIASSTNLRLDTAFDAVRSAKRVRLVITDACRDDPFSARAGNSKSSVLKVAVPPPDVIVAYSTGAGSVAMDGAGNISPYAEALIQALREPGIELSKVFRRVSSQVKSATGGQQIPTVMGNWPDEDIIVSR